MSDQEALERKLRRLEDREAIRELVARYGFVIDDRDMEGIGELFHPDARFRSRDGGLDAQGREAVLDQFRDRFSVLGITNHFTHDQIITFENDDRARGLVNSHAEVVYKGKAMLAALRYSDIYVRDKGKWVFSDRLLSFAYYVPVEDYARVVTAGDRILAYENPLPADGPKGG